MIMKNKMRILICLAVSTAMTLSLASCGSSSSGSSAPAEPVKEEAPAETAAEPAAETPAEAAEPAAETPAEAAEPAAETPAEAEAEPAAEAPAEAEAEPAAEAPAEAEADTGEPPREIIPAEGVATGDGTEYEFTNQGFVLHVPAEYVDLLVVEAPESSKDGTLFIVSEKASLEAGMVQSPDYTGAGELFSIRHVGDEEFHEMLCDDMSGIEPFAKDDNGNHFLFCHPTDVRLLRDGNITNEDFEAWEAYQEWAYTNPDKFLAENNLKVDRHSNTDLDMYLARIAYRGDVNYTISNLEYGPLEPGDVDPVPYVEKLINDAVFTEVTDEEAPDGEYVVLMITDDNIRFDFFYADDKLDYVRQVWSDDMEMLYKYVCINEERTSTGIMDEWYHEIAAANGK